MVDRERVERYLESLNRSTQKLELIRGKGLDNFQASDDMQLLVERLLQVAIQACIDIGAHVIAESGFKAPDDYASVFDVLAENGLIDRGLAEQLIKAVGTRNVLVHAYLEIDPGLIWASVEHLGDLVNFAKAMTKYLD